MNWNRVFPSAVLALFTLACTGTEADESKGYRLPPRAIIDIAEAPPTPFVLLDPTRRWLLLAERPALPPLAEVAEPELGLAGLRLNPATNARSRRTTASSLTLVSVAGVSQVEIQGLPRAPRIDHIAFAPDGRRFAFSHTSDTAVELWVADTATARAQRLLRGLNAMFPGNPYRWRSDGRSLTALTVPAKRSAAPVAPRVPTGPLVQETTGEAAAAPTYQDLLESPHDEALFEYYGTSQVVEVRLDGKLKRVGSPSLIDRAEPSPDGKYLLVERIERPFSYLIPYRRFARRVEVWNRSGKTTRELGQLPLAETVPIGQNAAPTGPRAIGWRPDEDATLYWVEAQDGGDPRAEASVRDRLYAWPAPFAGTPKELAALALRFAEVYWSSDHRALVYEWWAADRRERIWKLEPGAEKMELLFDYSSEDRYSLPGRPLSQRTATGAEVLWTTDQGRIAFFVSEGASPDGDRPFLDAVNLETGEKTRVFRSEPPYYEYPVAVVDVAAPSILTRRESRDKPPNYFVRRLDGSEPRALTRFPNPYPGLQGSRRELLRYQRADGLALSARLHLPPGYTPADGRLPLLVWAYPREYRSSDAAAQVRESPYRFTRVTPGSPLYWLTQGYAVLDDAPMPIIGEGGEQPNETFVQQLVADAQAVVDAAVERGVADPERVGVGGHSYGAFMAANLLAHSDIFRAGIARSGAYNRTLTPFGFQWEERTFWEAPETYAIMSPFVFADSVNEPILLIHGEADENDGTYPIQSQRFYRALKGHGATARLVLLPAEGHHYSARESVLHVLWEQHRWLEKYVKNAPPRSSTSK